jgi:AcrR family transcriptional regulator
MRAVHRGGDPTGPPAEGRVAANRRRRSEAFLAAGLRIATEEGIDALTMGRLAQALHTSVGAVYRYYASKDELIAAIQANAVEQLHRSHDRSVGPVATEVAAQVAGTGSAALVRVVVLGRWFCAAAERYPEELRLLQMVSSRRTPTHTPANAAALLPVTIAFVSAISDTIDAAVASGDLRPGEGLARAILWLTAFGGVFVADDLGSYVPSVLGGGRLIRQLNTDLLVGWGAAPGAVQRIEHAIDALVRSTPLIR